jgi:hypothetical protein
VGAVTVLLVGFAIWYGARGGQEPVCTASAEHEVRVASDAFTPSEISVKRCDVLKIINAGREDYDLMFGQRDQHVSYPGFQMTLIRPNEFFVVDMVQTGTYEMHDHIRDKAHLQLEIKE